MNNTRGLFDDDILMVLGAFLDDFDIKLKQSNHCFRRHGPQKQENQTETERNTETRNVMSSIRTRDELKSEKFMCRSYLRTVYFGILHNSLQASVRNITSCCAPLCFSMFFFFD